MQSAGSLHTYPARDDLALREALSRATADALTPEQVVCSYGASAVIELVLRTQLAAGDEMIICPPTFGLYRRIAKVLGIRVITAPLVAPDFSLSVDGIVAAVTANTKLVVVCTPNNPTGTPANAAHLEQLIERLPAHVLVLVDEAYVEYAASGPISPALGHILANKRVISIRSFSKIWGLAGLRLGYAFAPVPAATALRGHQHPFHLGALHIIAGIAAVSDLEHRQRSCELVQAGKRRLYAAFESMGLDYWPSEANFVLFRPPGSADDARRQLLERGYVVRETDSFGLPQHLRVSIGSEVAMTGFVQALEELGS